MAEERIHCAPCVGEGALQLGTVVFVSRRAAYAFRSPREIVTARSVSEVCAALAQVQRAVDAGMHAAGYLAYEAASAFDSHLRTHTLSGPPLAWFALYDSGPVPVKAPPAAPYAVGTWEPLIDYRRYRGDLDRIRAYIAAGDTYQVNYTYPLTAGFSGDAYSWFWDLARTQRGDHAAFIHAGRYHIASASPELFFELDGTTLTTRPMKGTHRRGLWLEQEALHADRLAKSEKDRAENVMVVDLLRNDMGRISVPGSVEVTRLCEVERYETVLQMTSTIRSRTTATVPEILAALFPSGSVTGAPKVRTMEIIAELESYARGVYCGAIGWWGPNRRAMFNVPIRTAVVDSTMGLAQYHAGGGITWGSDPAGEWDECQVKTAILSRKPAQFELLESLLWDGKAYFLLEEHLERLRASARYFDVPLPDHRPEQILAEARDTLGAMPRKVRVLVSRDGTVRLAAGPAPEPATVKLGFACNPVDTGDVFLYHKTTFRRTYDDARATRPDCEDVLLWNSRGEVTESTTANIAVRFGDRWVTPPRECGLLAGTLRQRLLREGLLREQVLKKTDIVRADDIKLINSVRKWIPVRLVDTLR